MRIFHNVTKADRRLWKAPLVSQLFPFLWAEPHHADVSLFCEDRSWQNDFSNSRSRITAWVARFLLKRSWRTVPVARYLTNVSVCLEINKQGGIDMEKKLIRYSMQIAMLNQLLARKMISEKEYALVKSKLMQDYKIVSDITA